MATEQTADPKEMETVRWELEFIRKEAGDALRCAHDIEFRINSWIHGDLSERLFIFELEMYLQRLEEHLKKIAG